MTGDTLELTNAEGDTVMRFRAPAAPGLVGTSWVATGINNGGGVVSSLALEAARATVTVADDVPGMSLGDDDRAALSDELARADDMRRTLA